MMPDVGCIYSEQTWTNVTVAGEDEVEAGVLNLEVYPDISFNLCGCYFKCAAFYPNVQCTKQYWAVYIVQEFLLNSVQVCSAKPWDLFTDVFASQEQASI